MISLDLTGRDLGCFMLKVFLFEVNFIALKKENNSHLPISIQLLPIFVTFYNKPGLGFVINCKGLGSVLFYNYTYHSHIAESGQRLNNSFLTPFINLIFSNTVNTKNLGKSFSNR